MAFQAHPVVNEPGGIVVGATKNGRLLIDKSIQHLRIIGPTGSGKTWSFFFPTLMRSWRGSAVVHDRKGDFWLMLQGSRNWRHNVLFAPSEEVTARYNPMARISSGRAQIAEAQNLAGLFPHNDVKFAKEPIWDNNSVALLAGQIMFLNNFGEPHERNFAGLRAFHQSGKRGAARMMTQEHPDPVIRDEIAGAARKVYENDNDRYTGSITATIDSYLNVYADPLVANAVSTCDFTPEDLVCGADPMMICMLLTPKHSERLAPLARMMISQILSALMGHQDKVGDLWKKHHLLWAMDEFNRFSRVKAFEEAFADMRSYHMRVMLGAQSDAILGDIYGKNSLIFNNSRLVAMRPLHHPEAEVLSKMIGTKEVVAESDSASFGEIGQARGSGLSRSRVRKPIMTAEEVLRMSEEEVLVLNHPKPIKCVRPPLSSWQTLVDPQPRSWKPLDCELLPVVDGDGNYLDLPPVIVDRNPWDKIKYDEPVFEAEPEPEPEPVAEKPHGIGGKVFDWQDEKVNVSPGRRTKVYPEPVGPLRPVPIKAQSNPDDLKVLDDEPLMM